MLIKSLTLEHVIASRRHHGLVEKADPFWNLALSMNECPEALMISRNRFLAIFVALAAWLTSLCLFMEPSHACCQGAKHALSKVLPECCVSQLVVQPQDQSGNGPDPSQWVSFNAENPLAHLAVARMPMEPSILAQAHVPDQSNRYLELRVLLN